MLCLPWFVDFAPDGPSEFHPLPASYRPLVNGKEAFGAVHDAIGAAKHTIDIICWGFQPSMHFRRDGSAPCIGELLIEKGKHGVKIRILCWLDSILMAQISEASMPQYSASRIFSQNEGQMQVAYDWQWYRRARLARSSSSRAETRDQARPFSSPINGPAMGQTAMIGPPLRDIGIEVVTRDFSIQDRREILYRESLARHANPNLSRLMIGAYGAEPSHHQKMVLVDYEAPSLAVGFVMGHNMLDAYWDDDDHSYVKRAPNRGRNGATPRQDMSAMVTGPILEHLNVNFCRAWLRDAKEDLIASRGPLAKQLEVRRDKGAGVMAQITRTQSQEGVRNIKSLYLQAVRNATQFIYVENQYFRWEPFATQVKEVARQHVSWGRDPGRDGAIHLFVVTNSTDDAVGMGTGTTYDMLAGLGRGDLMPGVARLERSDALEAALKDAKRQETIANTRMRSVSGAQARSEVQKVLDAAREKVETAQRNLEDHRRGKTPIVPAEIPGLKIHVCTLVAPDSPADDWMPVYVHSKILIVDDVFLTHGSANVNRRSMEVDSELNICHENMAVTQKLRRHLWNMHTSGQGGHDDPREAFVQWGKLMKRNKARQSNGAAPAAPLVEFMRTSTSRLRLD